MPPGGEEGQATMGIPSSQSLPRIVQEAAPGPGVADTKTPLCPEQFPARSQGASGVQDGPRGKRYQGGAQWGKDEESPK